MTLKALTLLALVALLLAPAGARGDELAAPTTIDAVQIRGLWRTEPMVVLRELPWQSGQRVSPEQWRRGIANLWNTGLFSQVSGAVTERDGQHLATLTVEERWTINPLFSFAVLVKRDARPGEASSWWSVGASDTNVLGKFIEIAGRYEQFNAFSGGQVYLRDPRFLGQRLDGLLQVDRLVRPRIGFADRRTMLRGELNKLLNGDQLRLGGRVELLQDQLFDAGDTPPRLPPDAHTALVDLGARVGRVDTVRLRQTGQSVELRLGAGVSDVVGQATVLHGQSWLQGLGYWMLGERCNVAARLVAGRVSDLTPAHLQYFVGGLYEVRGVRDSYLRARQFALGNIELRAIALDSMWLAVIPTAFVDGAVAQDADRGWTGLLSSGAGVRLLVPRFVRTGLRIDVALPLAGMPCTGARIGGTCPALSLGIFQFF